MKNFPRGQIDLFLSIIITSLVVMIDRITKNYFDDLLSFGESLVVIKNFLYFTLVYNTGIAFGFFKDQGIIFIIIIPAVAIILLIYNIYYYRRNKEVLSRFYIIAFSLILGGAIGNLIDRIVHGFVIDFIDFHFGSFAWPAFNIADSAITIGALMICVQCFQLSGKN